MELGLGTTGTRNGRDLAAMAVARRRIGLVAGIPERKAGPTSSQVMATKFVVIVYEGE
jgi:hypothetical protein